MKMDDATARTALHSRDLSQRDKVLLLLAYSGGGPTESEALTSHAVALGYPAARRWRMSSILSKVKPKAIRLPEGWLLTEAGKERLAEVGLARHRAPPKNAAVDLRSHLTRIKNADVKAFIEESVACLEHGHLRSAVVLSWVGAMAVLQDHVIKQTLAAFNAEAQRRDQKWKSARTPDDLGRMKEFEFLNVLEAISVIGKNVKKELQNTCLELRNAAGHPNSLKIGPNRVATHIEVLIDNVFLRFV